MSIKLVASDLDGTIIDRNHYIPEQNLNAIEKIHKKNIPFVICTGKSYSVSKNICNQFRASFGIFGNGTQIIDFKTGKELLKNTLSQEDLLYVATLSKRYNYHIHLYTETEIITEKLSYMDLRNFVLKSQTTDIDLKFVTVKNIIDHIANHSLNVFSAVITTEESIMDFENLLSINKNIESTLIRKRGIYKDTIINKEYEYLNISPTHINKNEALNFLGNYLNIARKDMLALGDNLNDFEMIKHSGIGVAINNSYEDLQKVASYTTKRDVTNGGFAEAIDKFLEI